MVPRVRDLTLEEGQKLRRIVRHGQNAIEFKRAQIILASYQGNTPPRIAIIALASEDYIRGVIRAFNEHGMAMLRPKWGPGRPPKFTDEQRKALVNLALSRPRDLGLPYAQWSLSRLRQQAVQRGLVPSISEEWLRVILHEDEVSHSSIRTWKTSPDPRFEEKKRKIDRLTRTRHNPPIILSAGEIGPIQLIPHGGERWFPQPRPGRIPAEYNLRDGLLLPHAERVPPALVRSALSDEACGELAGVSEGRSGGISHQLVGQSDLGRGTQPLDGGHS